MDERRWREKVRRFEFEAKDLRAERDRLREELAGYLSSPKPLWPDDDPTIVAMAQERDTLKAAVEELRKQADTLLDERNAATDQIKELKDKIKGLNMQLGRLKSK